MKNLRVGLMGILIILMSNLMITRAEAATKTEDGYTYSTDGLMTSNTLFSEQRINEYDGRKNNSVIRCYKVKNYYNPTIRYKGVLQILKGDAYKTITLPPMLEQITVHGVFLYAIFESAAKPYVDGSDDNGKAKRVMTNYCILSAESVFK